MYAPHYRGSPFLCLELVGPDQTFHKHQSLNLVKCKEIGGRLLGQIEAQRLKEETGEGRKVPPRKFQMSTRYALGKEHGLGRQTGLGLNSSPGTY